MQTKKPATYPTAPERRRTTQDARRPFRALFGNTASYTPATDLTQTPFVASADCYSPPASNADPSPSYDGGGGTFDGAGASGDF